MAWSCSAGRFNWHYTVDETVHIISGEVFVTDHKGETHRLGPGDMAFFPALAGGLAIGAFVGLSFQPAVSAHFSPKGVYDA